MSELSGREQLDWLEANLLDMAAKTTNPVHRVVLIEAANHVSWDDAIHIAAPWEKRSSLCGNWFRNLVALDEPRPDGVAGCWTCLLAAEWMDENLAKEAKA